MKYSSLILNQNNESWIFKLLENDFFKILNSQVISSLLGAVVTIFGVVLTIRHERKMRESIDVYIIFFSLFFKNKNKIKIMTLVNCMIKLC